MSEKIEPALTPDEWSREERCPFNAPVATIIRDGGSVVENRIFRHVPNEHSQVVLRIGGESRYREELPAIIALANHALRDDDPRKITRAMVGNIRSAASLIRSTTDATHESALSGLLREYAVALEAYLPPS